MSSSTVQRTFYQDPYSDIKMWEVVKLRGGYYLRQYIGGRQFGKGIRTTKRFMKDIGIFDFQVIEILG